MPPPCSISDYEVNPRCCSGAGIKVNDYFESYQKNRKSAIIDLTEDLKKQFEESIVEYRSIYPKNPKKTKILSTDSIKINVLLVKK